MTAGWPLSWTQATAGSSGSPLPHLGLYMPPTVFTAETIFKDTDLGDSGVAETTRIEYMTNPH